MTTFSQRLIWTALPRGRFEDGSYHVVAFISPQLSTSDGSSVAPDATLADFPDFVSWPETLAAIEHNVVFTVNGVTYGNSDFPLPVEVVTPRGVDAKMWRALFPPTTLVHSFKPVDPAIANAPVESAPASQLRNFAKNLYKSVVTSSPTEHPPVAGLSNALAPVNFFGPEGDARRKSIQTQLDDDYTKQGFVSPRPGQIGHAAVQHQRFLSGFGPGNRRPTKTIAPTRDFHEYVSGLGHYRDLVRLLGFAIDLKVTVTLPDPTLPPDPCFVQVAPRWSPSLANSVSQAVDVRPQTAFVYGNGFFLARPRQSKALLVGGRLPLADAERFTPIELDHDGATIKLGMLAANMARAASDPGNLQPKREALPVLRSSGIALAAPGVASDPDRPPLAGEIALEVKRGVAFSKQMATTADGSDIQMYAEDVNRGFRYDVWDDKTNAWHSLSARAGQFTYIDPDTREAKAAPTDDEAISILAPTKGQGSTPGEPMRHQETLFHWTGWSLGAHMPGQHPRPALRTHG